MKNHKPQEHSHWKMMLGCLGALLLVFLLPFLRVSKSTSIIITVIAVILLHIPRFKEMAK